MGKINVLSFAVANLIAAGEVVDRPSSVIKELLENAIDSGANRITVEIQNGGVTYMRVADNGCGISREDLPIAIRRHATSKIKEAKDLDGILTLGFRGEALAAIASVSDIRIISKIEDESTGAMLEAHGGEIVGVTERACSNGTTVIVENLFANVPARRKFLKKDVTESMAVNALVEKIALSKPDIAFRLIIDGNIRLETVGDGNLKNAIYSIFGREFASKLIDTDITVDGIEVSGFISRSDNVRANRNYQNFFINGRYVKSKTAMAALEQAYTSYIPPEKFPCCILFLKINPATVDVNVHPAKLEVKFSNEKPVFEAVYYAVRNALESNADRPNMLFTPIRSKAKDHIGSKLSESTTPIIDQKEESLKKRQLTSDIYVYDNSAKETEKNNISKEKTYDVAAFEHMSATDYVSKYIGVTDTPKNIIKSNEYIKKESSVSISHNDINATDTIINKEAVKKDISDKFKEKKEDILKAENSSVEGKEDKSSKLWEYRIIGEAFNSYVIVESGEKILIIDKHAAHERIIFEQLKAGMHNRNKASQLLMFPLEIMMTTDEIQSLAQFVDDIEAVGFEFTVGKYTVNVSAIPEGISTDSVGDMFTVMADRIKNNTGSAKLTRDIVFEKALYQASCKAAIKAGREYPHEHVKWIVDKLMELPDITVCPHGRPVAMELSKKNIDHQFERT